jgi:predicted enzyme related to lactoylglutathione lyase
LSDRLVHLELHTGDLPRACAFYDELFDWELRNVRAGCHSYLEIDFQSQVGGGVVDCRVRAPRWIPYVEVGDIEASTERGRELGAAVLLQPREGPAGWRSVLASPHAGEVALWLPKVR